MKSRGWSEECPSCMKKCDELIWGGSLTVLVGCKSDKLLCIHKKLEQAARSLAKLVNYLGAATIKNSNCANSTNLLGIKDAANQEVKKNESSLRYIFLPNWAHDALLESTSSKPYEESSSQVLEGSGNPNPTDSTFNPPAEQIETLIVESPIPTVSSPVLTVCVNDSSEPSSEARLVSKRVANQEETPSLDNILSLINRFDDILGVSTSSDEIIGVEADEMTQLVPVEDVYVQALQFKHPIIDWKIHTEGQRSYCQIIRLGGSSACYQFFVDLLKQLDMEDLN
nr:hypothetical protein [Tanacetum cinerariifolium]